MFKRTNAAPSDVIEQPSRRSGSRTATSPTLIAMIGMIAMIGLSGCQSAPHKEGLPPQTVTGPAISSAGVAPTSAPSSTAPAPTSPQASVPSSSQPSSGASGGQEPGDTSEAHDTTLVVVGGVQDSDGIPTDSRQALLRAAQVERERRRHARAPIAVITDENLAEMAEGGNVTIGSAPPVSPETADSSATTSDGTEFQDMGADERYWRTRALEIRRSWRDSYDSISELESRAAELRNRFYAEDDPVRRDREIKPEWDRTLDRLADAKRDVQDSQRDLASLQEEGRRAGALPGWLREGIDLEPPPTTDEGPFDEEPEAGEPVVVEPVG